MFDAAVAVGIAAFLSGQQPPDDEAILAELEAGGVEPWLSERLLVYLPVAFGRQLFQEITFSDQMVSDGVSRPLADDPVYRAASERARLANRTEMERIALRSGEVNAINDALHGGAQLAELKGAPLTLTAPLRPMGAGDGGVPSPRSAFAALLGGHGFPVDGGRTGARTGPLELDATVFAHPSPGPGLVVAQVDFAVRHPALAMPWLVESFAAVGRGWREAIHEATVKFERGSLHPIIAGLLDHRACADQVSWQAYQHPSGQFSLCLGPQLEMFASQPAPPAGPLVDALLRALREVPLSPAVHSLRLFTSYRDGRLETNEVLLDGEPWPAGAALVATAPPPASTGMLTVRVFGLLVPHAPAPVPGGA